MNNQQGIQWGREGYERGRNKKQKQEDYRNALQRQMRERERSRRRRSRNNDAVEKTNSAEQLRKITSRHRAPTPEVVSPPTSSATGSNNQIVQQVMTRNASHISDILARLRRLETEQTKSKFQVDPVQDIKSETEHRLEMMQQKLETTEGLASSLQRKSEERVAHLNNNVRELRETLIAQRKEHERIQSGLMQRIELLERRLNSKSESNSGGTITQKRVQQLENALEKLRSGAALEARKALAERRAQSQEMSTVRDELRKIQDKTSETIQESKALVRVVCLSRYFFCNHTENTNYCITQNYYTLEH